MTNEKTNEINGYEFSRRWFDFAFENPDKIRPIHGIIYLFAVEHCNRLGWKNKFGFPTTMVMDAIGIKKYQTYIAAFNDLVDWGFFDLIQKSKNQYSSNIISIISPANALPKNGKALDKALIKHGVKHGVKQHKSMGSIDKQINNKQINKKQINKKKYGDFKNVLLADEEIEKLKNKFTDWENKIKTLDEGIELKGYKYKSHYLAILKWSANEKNKNNSSFTEY